MFPDLKRLERKYAKELVVIGVHSAKFPNEKDSDSLREAVVRHNLEHPVVNDADFKIFRAYGAQGWPHFVVVDPEGTIAAETSGEGRYEELDLAIGALVQKFDKAIDRTPRAFGLDKSKRREGVLAYPGKVLATADRLYIADTNHHRVLVTDPEGRILHAIEGFHHPQGMAIRGSTLWVADTENHLLREVDLATRTVRTIAGTGGREFRRAGTLDALRVPLNSPWDLAVDGDALYVAMAGNHQIWRMDLANGTIGPFSGDGGEDLRDGPHASAQYAQPSGLALAGRTLFVADAEASAIRSVDLDPKGAARTIVGKGLFVFGDRDGAADEVRLQHVLGVAWLNGKLYVADAYNHKIRVCDPAKREVRTLFGDGKKGHEDGRAARFSEPGGLSGCGRTIFVADQNNHAIRACDLETGEVRTLKVERR